MPQVGSLLHEGKAKKVYELTSSKQHLFLEFKDNLTAFNGEKISSLPQKGSLCRDISSHLFRVLQAKNISTHWVEDEAEASMVVLKLDMIPLEVVIRNILAGSTAKKFKKKPGTKLPTPLFELYYKDDDLQDPFLNSSQALWLGASESLKELDEIKILSLKVNQIFLDLFSPKGIDVVDFKLEWGRLEGKLVLADELSPDNFRLWDQETGKSLDKDLFRKDLGGVIEAYKKVLSRLSKEV